MLPRLLKALWLYIAGIIAVAVIYFLLTGIEQGIDVVIQCGESPGPAIYGIVAVILWAFLVWYSARILGYIKQCKEDSIYSKKCDDDTISEELYHKNAIPASLHQHIPRLLAYNCFVSIQAAIFNLPSFYRLSFISLLLFAAVHNGLYYLLSQWFKRSIDRKHPGYFRIAALVVSILYAGVLVRQMILMHATAHTYERHKFWLPLIALILFVMQLLSVYYFNWRRKQIDINLLKGGKQSKALSKMKANGKFNAAEAPYFKIYNIVASIAILIYLSAIFNIYISGSVGPMAFVLLALGVLVGFANMVSVLSIRTSVNMFLFLYLLAFIVGKFGSPYKVRLLETEKKEIYAARPDIKAYLTRWLEQRKHLLDTNRKFPIYLVMSNGGASRAGNWVSGVLSSLQDSSYKKNPKNTFADHLLCIAGASGGSVGNCAFYSMLRARKDGLLTDSLSSHNKEFFYTDFLTFTLGRLLGPDFFRHVIPLPISDRAAAIEEVLANGSTDKMMNSYFCKPLDEVLDYSGQLPVLFINTTRVADGMPGVISSVRLPLASQRIDVLNLIDKVSLDTCSKEGNIRLSTAAILSSRFPYVSPAGEILHHYFVDGGYFDNSGAGIILEFIQELNTFLADTTNPLVKTYRKGLSFHLLHIYNSEVLPPGTVYVPKKDIHPLTNDMMAPLLTLAGMQNSSTKIGNGILKNSFQQLNKDRKDAVIEYSLYRSSWDSVKNCVTSEEPYPMSWAISDYQLERMQQRIDAANKENKNRFWFLK